MSAGEAAARSGGGDVRSARGWGLGLRSAGVSVITTLVDAGLFALCTLLLAGAALLCARWLCGAVGALCNFSLNRVWAFRVQRGKVLPQLWRYGVTALASVSLATLVWWALRAATGADPRLLHLCSLALVWLLFSFPMLRGWVFCAGAR